MYTYLSLSLHFPLSLSSLSRFLSLPFFLSLSLTHSFFSFSNNQARTFPFSSLQSVIYVIGLFNSRCAIRGLSSSQLPVYIFEKILICC